jgi:AcrR family transcriptional regulator
MAPFVKEILLSPGPKATEEDEHGKIGLLRPLRADAQRNRDRILAAAEAVFAAEGPDVHVEAIAETAGVGVGTLYRHFPTKQKLCEAVLLGRLSALVLEAQRLADNEDPGRVFFSFLEHLAQEAASKRDLVLMVGEDLGFKEELGASVGVLLRRAQSVGAVRPEVSTTTVLSLVAAAAQASAQMKADLHQLVAVISDGLRPPAGALPSVS